MSYLKKHVVKVLIIDSKKRCLLLFRSRLHPLYGGQIDFPGGLVDIHDSETALEACVRETYEETGITLRAPVKKIFRHHVKTKEEDITYDFYINEVISLSDLAIILSNEHAGYQLVKISELQEFNARLTDNYIKYAIKYIQNNLISLKFVTQIGVN